MKGLWRWVRDLCGQNSGHLAPVVDTTTLCRCLIFCAMQRDCWCWRIMFMTFSLFIGSPPTIAREKWVCIGSPAGSSALRDTENSPVNEFLKSHRQSGVDIDEPVPKLETQNSDSSGLLMSSRDTVVHMSYEALPREMNTVTTFTDVC